MIECIFTLDYEIYGDGSGTLNELVYQPGEKLREIFQRRNARFVAFVEAAEFEQIEAWGTDSGIHDVKRQIGDFHREGFEIGLHLHPQWCNARYEGGAWALDYSEYNLCVLTRARISQIVGRSIDYLRAAVGQPDFTPVSFRAGNWLFQPTETAASVLLEKGIRIDSSVFKGGLQHSHALDYRAAVKNGYYWQFGRDVTEPDSRGGFWEVPIYAELVPFWKMVTSKRMGFKRGGGAARGQNVANRVNRALDLMRFLYPLKLDFCRMTIEELTSAMNKIVREDKSDPSVYRPIVAIGHTKDLSDPQTVDDFLSFLNNNGIAVATFATARRNLLGAAAPSASLREFGLHASSGTPNAERVS